MSTYNTLWMVIWIIRCHHIMCQSLSNSDAEGQHVEPAHFEERRPYLCLQLSLQWRCKSGDKISWNDGDHDISISQSHDFSSSNMEHTATLEPSFTPSHLHSSVSDIYTMSSDDFAVSSTSRSVVPSEVVSNMQSSFSSEDVITSYKETERSVFSLSNTYIESYTTNNMDLSTSLATVISEYRIQSSDKLTESDSVALTFSSIYSSSIYINGTTASGNNDLKTNSALLISSVSDSSIAQNISLFPGMDIYSSSSFSSVSDELVELIGSSSIQITQTITNGMSISETRISEVYSTEMNLQQTSGTSFVSDFRFSISEALDSSSMEASPAFETMYTVTIDYSSTSMDTSFISPIDAIELSKTVLISDVSQQSDTPYFTSEYIATQMTGEMSELSSSVYVKLSTVLETIQLETLSERIAATKVSSIMLSSTAVQSATEGVNTEFEVSQASELYSNSKISDSMVTTESDSLNLQTPFTITPSSYLQYATSEGVTSIFETGESSGSNSISTNLLGTSFIETDISIASTSLQVSTIQTINNVSDISTISTSILSDSSVTVTNRETNFDSTVSFAQASLFTSHVNIESSILEPSNVSHIGTIDLDFSSDTPSYNTFDLSLSSQPIRTTYSDFSVSTTLVVETGITDLPFTSIQGSDIAATKSRDSSGFIQTISTFGRDSETNPSSSESVELSQSKTLLSSITGQGSANSDVLSITTNVLPTYSNTIQTSGFNISESSMLVEKSSSSSPLLETSEYSSVTMDTIVTKFDSTALFVTISTEQSSEKQSFFTTTSQFNEVSSALTIDSSSLGMTSTLSSNVVPTSLSSSAGPFDLSLNTISSLPSESTYPSEMSVITSTPLYSLTDISSVMASNNTLLPTMVSTTRIDSQFESSTTITLSPSSVPLELSPFSQLYTNSDQSMLSDDSTSTEQSYMPSIDVSSSTIFLQSSSSASELTVTLSTLSLQYATTLSVSSETIETQGLSIYPSQTELLTSPQTISESYDSSIFSESETISPTSVIIETSSDTLQQSSNIISQTQNTASVDSLSTVSDDDISMFSISPTDILSSMVVTTVNSSDILMSSVDSTISLSTSLMPSVTNTTNSTTTTSSSATTPSTTETTPQTPQQTTDNITNTDESFWVKTVLSVRKTVDISSLSFREDIEPRLAEAYNEAFERERLIAQGLFENLRRRRYVNVGDASVHIHDVSRLGDTTSVNVVYAVEKSGTKLSPAEAVTSLNVLSTQELAIILRQVVQTVAEPYQSSSKPDDTEDGGIPLWLVAAITGSVGGFIILVWVFVCVYMKCCREKKELEKQVEPELTSIQQDAARREPQRRDVNTNGVGTSARKPLPHQASKASLAKKSSAYQMKPSDEEALIETMPEPEVEEHVYENRIPVQEQMYENKLVTQTASPSSRQRSPKMKKSESRPDGTGSTTSLSHKHDIEQASNNKKGKQRSSKLSDGPLPGMDYPDNSDKPRLLKYQVLQSSFSDQDNEDLRERALLERQRNKERIRNKRRKAKHKEDVHPTSVLYSTMGIPSTPLPSVQVESGSPVRDTNNRRASRNLDGGVSTENLSGDESLHEARTRMHKLLDDAFSLISPRASFTENNFPRPTESQGGIYINKDDGLPTGNESHQHIDGHRGRDVKHEPMYVNPFYSESTFPLETWSPYRTSDLVAMISMPSQQESTKLGQKPKSATRPSSSKPNRRPAANFDFNETKSASTFEEDRFTTSPGKPIVIRSRDNTENAPSNSNRQSNNRLSSGRATVMVSPLPKTTQNEQYEMNSIPKGSSRNGSAGRSKSRSIDRSNVDEVDVINDLDVGQNSDKLIKSLRDELGELKELYSVPNTRIQRKKNRKNAQDSNTEAV